jgi:hypothetical protein
VVAGIVVGVVGAAVLAVADAVRARRDDIVSVPTWCGTAVRPGRLITDGHTLFVVAKIRTTALLKRLAKSTRYRDRLATQYRASKIFRGFYSGRQRPVVIGATWKRIAGLEQRYVPVTARRGRGLCHVDAAKLRLVNRAVRWTRATMRRFRMSEAVVFWDGDRPVALLMPLRTSLDQWQ